MILQPVSFLLYVLYSTISANICNISSNMLVKGDVIRYYVIITRSRAVNHSVRSPEAAHASTLSHRLLITATFLHRARHA